MGRHGLSDKNYRMRVAAFFVFHWNPAEWERC